MTAKSVQNCTETSEDLAAFIANVWECKWIDVSAEPAACVRCLKKYTDSSALRFEGNMFLWKASFNSIRPHGVISRRQLSSKFAVAIYFKPDDYSLLYVTENLFTTESSYTCTSVAFKTCLIEDGYLLESKHTGQTAVIQVRTHKFVLCVYTTVFMLNAIRIWHLFPISFLHPYFLQPSLSVCLYPCLSWFLPCSSVLLNPPN